MRECRALSGCVSAIGLVTALVAAAPATAQSAARTFAVPRQGARTGLVQFAQQAGIQILVTTGDTKGRVVGPLVGRYTVQDGLKRIVASTGLGLASFDGTTAVLQVARFSARPIAANAAMIQTGVAASEQVESQPQAIPAPESEREQDVLVVGTRLGAGDAADVKRRALQSISVLTAADIEHMPDTSLASLLRRVPGVQVSTSGGGGTIRIRGLGQIEERVNGRNLTSTVGRGYDVAALPSDLISGVDVYKTPSASLLEGGIGGQIDFHTRRPFDFKGIAAAASGQAAYSDINGSVQPFLSGYVSDRWKTGIGEVGLLVGGSFQREALGQRIVSGFNGPRTSGGRTVIAPNGLNKTYFNGIKQLATGYGSAQWKPVDSFTLTGDFIYNRSSLDFVNQTLSANLAATTPPAAPGATPVSLTTYDGSDAVRSGTFRNVPLSSSTGRDDAFFETYQAALNGRYESGHLTLFGEVSYTNTNYQSVSPSATLSATAPTLSFDTGARRPDFIIGGLDPTSLANWKYASFNDYHARDTSTEWAYRADAFYTFDGPINTIKAGGRFDRRTVNSDNGFRDVTAPAGIAAPAAPYAGLISGDVGGDQPRWVAPSAFQFRHYPNSIRALFGAPLTPPPYDGANTFFADERIWNGYAEATFGFPLAGVVFDGNVGVRYAKTTIAIDSTQTQQDGSFTAISARQNYENWLPQVNVRAKLVSDLYLRLAYSKQLTRPGFFAFSPGLSLDFDSRTGSSGNPAIRPLRANQYDASLEWYFAKGGSIYIAGFYKDVKGFILYETRPEQIRGQIFQIERPYNLSQGWIRGTEIGYDHRFTFLPGALAGFGVNASYTFVDSSRPANSSGIPVPLTGLARHNYQIAGSYDRNGLYGSVAWVWNSRIVTAASGDSQGRPRYQAPYGQLDASFSFDVTPSVTLTANALNILQRRSEEFVGTRQYFGQSVVEDRRFLAGIRVKLGSGR